MVLFASRAEGSGFGDRVGRRCRLVRPRLAVQVLASHLLTALARPVSRSVRPCCCLRCATSSDDRTDWRDSKIGAIYEGTLVCPILSRQTLTLEPRHVQHPARNDRKAHPTQVRGLSSSIYRTSSHRPTYLYAFLHVFIARKRLRELAQAHLSPSCRSRSGRSRRDSALAYTKSRSVSLYTPSQSSRSSAHFVKASLCTHFPFELQLVSCRQISGKSCKQRSRPNNPQYSIHLDASDRPPRQQHDL